MRTFLKMILSALLVMGLLVFCDSLAMVVVLGTTLYFIWDSEKENKEIRKEDNSHGKF